MNTHLQRTLIKIAATTVAICALIFGTFSFAKPAQALDVPIIIIKLPDLAFTVVNGFPSPKLMITNKGNAVAGAFAIKIQVDGMVVSTQQWSGLAVGETKLVTMISNLGDYVVTADSANQVVEWNETNNFWQNYPPVVN